MVGALLMVQPMVPVHGLGVLCVGGESRARGQQQPPVPHVLVVVVVVVDGSETCRVAQIIFFIDLNKAIERVTNWLVDPLTHSLI